MFATARETYTHSRRCPRCKDTDHFDVHCKGWGIAFGYEDRAAMEKASARTDAWRKAGAYLAATPCRGCGRIEIAPLLAYFAGSTVRWSILLGFPLLLTSLESRSWWVALVCLLIVLGLGGFRLYQLIREAPRAVQRVPAPAED